MRGRATRCARAWKQRESKPAVAATNYSARVRNCSQLSEGSAEEETMGTVIHLPYTNYEILEAEFFAKTGHLMNEADTGLEVGGEADFGKTLNAPADLVGDIFEKARRAPVKRDVGRDGHHDSTARIAPVDDDLAEIDRAWAELLGGAEVDDDSKTKKVTSSE